jgi:site-specific recombinase XerD
VRALITACSNRAPTGVRNRALLVLLYLAGCRISEALRLLPKDLDRTNGTATVLRGKGGTRRTIGLDPGAFAVWSGGSTFGRSRASEAAPRSSAR